MALCNCNLRDICPNWLLLEKNCQADISVRVTSSYFSRDISEFSSSSERESERDI